MGKAIELWAETTEEEFLVEVKKVDNSIIWTKKLFREFW